MEFIKNLKEVVTDDTKKMRRILILNELYSRETEIRMTECLNVGNYQLSIQASYGHHSTPNITTDYANYTRMEMAIMQHNNYVNCEIFSDFKRIEELQEFFHNSVCSFVPIDLIQDFINFLEGC